MRALRWLLANNRDYRLLLSAGLVSMTGDWALGVGLTYLVYSITGSTLASGAMLLATFLPSILLGSVAGVMVDRWDRRTTMITANLLQIVGLVPLLFVHGAGTIWIVYLVGAWQGCVEQFFEPAEQALVPHLVPDEDLLGANGVNSQVRNAARLIGSGLGGVLAATGGIAGLAVFDAASFAAAAVLLLLIRHRAPRRPVVEQHDSLGSLSRAVHEWREGLRICAASPVLRVIMIWGAISATGEGIMGTLFAPFVRDVLHGTSSEYGVIVGIQAVGGLVGGLAVASAGHRWTAYALFGWGSVAFGCVDLVLFLYPLVFSGVVPAMVCMLVVGVPGAMAIAGMMTMFQRATADEFRGRVFGARTALYGCSVLAGIGIASWLGEVVGILPVIAFQGGGYVVAGGLVLIELRGTAIAKATVETDDTEETAEVAVVVESR